MIRLPPPMRIVSLVWQEIESILLVTLFSVLIWLYAEGENVKARELTFSVQLAPPPGVEMLIQPEGTQLVQVKFNAATSQYEQLRLLSLTPVKVQVREGEGGRETELNVRDAIAGLDPFKRLGLTPTEVQPRTLKVTAERYEKREGLEATVDPDASNVAAQPGTLALSPAKITIRMPVSKWARWDERKESPRIVLQAADLDRLSENQEKQLDAKVALPRDFTGPDVSVTPTTVLATFHVHKETDSTTIPSIRVMDKLPPLGLNPDTVWGVIIDDQFRFINNVKVTGSKDAIDRIKKSPETTVEAILELDDADLKPGGKPATKQVTLRVPAGVTIVSPTTPPTIEYTVIAGRKPAPAINP